MRFLLDAQLPSGLVRRMAGDGYEALHVTDLLPLDASDLEVARRANADGAILISKDADFAELSARGILKGALIWVRSGNMTTASLWAKLGPLLPTVVSAIESGERIVEIR